MWFKQTVQLPIGERWQPEETFVPELNNRLFLILFFGQLGRLILCLCHGRFTKKLHCIMLQGGSYKAECWQLKAFSSWKEVWQPKYVHFQSNKQITCCYNRQPEPDRTSLVMSAWTTWWKIVFVQGNSLNSSEVHSANKIKTIWISTYTANCGVQKDKHNVFDGVRRLSGRCRCRLQENISAGF